MKVKITVRPRADYQLACGRKLQQGFHRHGIQADIVPFSSGIRADVVVCWGWRNGRQIARHGSRVLLMERGYLADRFVWTSLGWDGLNGRARFPQRDDGGARFRRHFDGLLQPVRDDGTYALVLGQVSGDASLTGVDINRFYRDAAQALSPRFGARICFRQHPVQLKRAGHPGPFLHGMTVIDGDLASALDGAACAVAYNSNALTDAAIAGVPVIAADEGAMVWPIAGHGLQDAPKLDGREAWAHRLAWCQWLLEEMASGAAWEALRTAMEPERRAA